MRLLHDLATLLEMIKFQHSVFALPFALSGMLLAGHGWPGLATIFWIVTACVFARTAAMSFNRWADAAIDAKNPRTATRAIPAGKLSRNFALVVTLLSSALFVISAAMLNRLALWLSPVALFVLLGYSYTKHFTSASHFVLGLALGIAPAGAWIAVRGSLDLPPVLLSAAVLTWTAGFDLIYACQDYEFDRAHGLYSIPARFGLRWALRLSALLYLSTVLLLIAVGVAMHLGSWYYVGVGLVAALLTIEHLIVDPRDPAKIHAAFFTVNSWVGLVLFVFCCLDVFLK
ncbi:MAG: putative 4-hydroxybenzoate polyprenyltransferase [Candidatus Sumerlaea chitinivorans]|uniref:4-hydroxybenzoate polyprenyltransferase n=1 Tax=Sumerlaea chitinivorans TaxID=2250252 RepID=A0A2Z4Y2T5_SUMC1|nr:4-hydroxybenzoate polyprenyltransferase [Candidatus Sumerlaea chitinivorans]MCX7963518.1 putative 4-hydroxybenzoate polyprenyltransferase [Candidatus Sumerlaea chitinivorans]